MAESNYYDGHDPEFEFFTGEDIEFISMKRNGLSCYGQFRIVEGKPVFLNAKAVRGEDTPAEAYVDWIEVQKIMTERMIGRLRRRAERDSENRPTSVPSFKHYTPHEAELGPEQQEFYNEWLAAWKRGESLDVQGQVSYVFRYAYSVHFPWGHSISMKEASLSELQAAHAPLERIRTAYRHESILRDYLTLDIARIWIKLGEYRKALDEYDTLPVPAKVFSNLASLIMNLRMNIGEKLQAREVLWMCSNRLTEFGKNNMEDIAKHIDVHIDQIERQSGSILDRLARTARVQEPSPYMSEEFGTLEKYGFATPVEELRTPENPNANPVLDVFGDIIRSAENAVREDRGLPRIGEGWIAETELYYNIKNAMSEYKVEQHGRPNWLGQQHLDVWLPEINVAVEYHGLQHDQPVEFFGGAEAYKKTLERDARKRRKCEQNNVILIEVRPGYVLPDGIHFTAWIDPMVRFGCPGAFDLTLEPEKQTEVCDRR